MKKLVVRLKSKKNLIFTIENLMPLQNGIFS